jgi:hypothetical protein
MATIAKAKDHFQHDLLKGFQFHRDITGAAWVLHLEYRDQASTVALVDVRTKQARSFKTLEAVVRAAEEIGFSVDALFSPR